LKKCHQITQESVSLAEKNSQILKCQTLMDVCQYYLLFRVHPNVLQCDRFVSNAPDPSSGRQTGWTKSDRVTGCSSFTITTVLPSTGDLTIPTTARSWCHGEDPDKRILPSRATHCAFGCLQKKSVNIPPYSEV
jgi:hypothetical protein